MTNFQTSIWQNIAIFLMGIHKRLANEHALILAQVIQNVGPTGLTFYYLVCYIVNENKEVN